MFTRVCCRAPRARQTGYVRGALAATPAPSKLCQKPRAVTFRGKMSSCISLHPAPSIGSDETYIKDGGVAPACDSSASAISTSASSGDGYCSDHQDCNSWGPAAFEESGARIRCSRMRACHAFVSLLRAHVIPGRPPGNQVATIS